MYGVMVETAPAIPFKEAIKRYGHVMDIPRGTMIDVPDESMADLLNQIITADKRVKVGL